VLSIVNMLRKVIRTLCLLSRRIFVFVKTWNNDLCVYPVIIFHKFYVPSVSMFVQVCRVCIYAWIWWLYWGIYTSSVFIHSLYMCMCIYYVFVHSCTVFMANHAYTNCIWSQVHILYVYIVWKCVLCLSLSLLLYKKNAF